MHIFEKNAQFANTCTFCKTVHFAIKANFDKMHIFQETPPRSVRGVAAHETTWFPVFPHRTVGVSNYIQLDAIINPG